MSAGELILMGVIAGAHGIRGEVKLKSFTANPADIASYGVLSDETGGRLFEIVALKSAKDALIVRLSGVEDRSGAEALKGTKLFVPRGRMPAPDQDDYYHADLIGLDAVDASGNRIGRVLGVENYGAGDLLDIGDDTASELLPFTKAFVPEVDLAARRIVIAPPEDFLTSEAGVDAP